MILSASIANFRVLIPALACTIEMLANDSVTFCLLHGVDVWATHGLLDRLVLLGLTHSCYVLSAPTANFFWTTWRADVCHGLTAELKYR